MNKQRLQMMVATSDNTQHKICPEIAADVFSFTSSCPFTVHTYR